MSRFAGEGLIKLGMWYPYVNPKGFPAGDWRRAGVTADNTWDAIKRGERTATTRLPVWYGKSPGVLEQIKGIQPGQEIMFTRGNERMIVEAKPSPFSVHQANLYQKNSFIDSLEPNQVFVFGSNTEGRHGKGAALAARQKFGAQYGQAEGLQGQSYGLITKDLRTGRMPLEFIDGQVNKLYQQAQARPDLEFLVSPVGTNLAGWTPREMGPLFTQKNVPSNVSLPGAFLHPEYQGLGGSTYALTKEDMLSDNIRSAKLRDRWSQIEGWNEEFIPLLWNKEPSGVAYQFQYKPVNPTNRVNIDMAPRGQVVVPPPPQPIIQQLASPASPAINDTPILQRVLGGYGKDGQDFINIYSKGQTDLGRWLTNFAESPLTIPGDGDFRSLEGYWHWLGTKDDELRDMAGYQAFKRGQDLKKAGMRKPVDGFEDRIKNALDIKLKTYPQRMEELARTDLPLVHYYEYGNTRRPAGFEWITDHYTNRRQQLKDTIDKWSTRRT